MNLTMQMYRSKLAETFARARLRAGQSQRKTAAELHVSEDTISHAECRRRPLKYELALQAARLWGGKANDLAVQAAHEATGMHPAWSDGDRFDKHPLAHLVRDEKEDAEADEAIKAMKQVLILAEWSNEIKERAAGMAIEVLEGCATRIDLVCAMCDKGELDIMALWEVVHERRSAAGIVRRVA
jgi:transcriptional regulator with XRE-family HTH domain